MPEPERRRRRSLDPLTALHYQLAACRQAGGLDAVVLADPTGVVVAADGPWAACEELAAYAPLLLCREPAPSHFAASRVCDVAAHADAIGFDAGGHEVIVCARGDRDRRTDWLERAAAGCRRILAAPAA